MVVIGIQQHIGHPVHGADAVQEVVCKDKVLDPMQVFRDLLVVLGHLQQGVSAALPQGLADDPDALFGRIAFRLVMFIIVRERQAKAYFPAGLRIQERIAEEVSVQCVVGTDVVEKHHRTEFADELLIGHVPGIFGHIRERLPILGLQGEGFNVQHPGVGSQVHDLVRMLVPI